MKIKSNGNQVFNIPNNEEGQQFLYLAKKFINNDKYNLHGRGRGSRVRNGKRVAWKDSIAQGLSDWIAVYIHTKENPYNDCHPDRLQLFKDRVTDFIAHDCEV